MVNVAHTCCDDSVGNAELKLESLGAHLTAFEISPRVMAGWLFLIPPGASDLNTLGTQNET